MPRVSEPQASSSPEGQEGLWGPWVNGRADGGTERCAGSCLQSCLCSALSCHQVLQHLCCGERLPGLCQAVDPSLPVALGPRVLSPVWTVPKVPLGTDSVLPRTNEVPALPFPFLLCFKHEKQGLSLRFLPAVADHQPGPVCLRELGCAGGRQSCLWEAPACKDEAGAGSWWLSQGFLAPGWLIQCCCGPVVVDKQPGNEVRRERDRTG